MPGGGEKISERTRGPMERVRAAGGNGAHGTEQPPLPRQWFSQRFAPASLRFAPRSGFPSGYVLVHIVACPPVISRDQ